MRVNGNILMSEVDVVSHSTTTWLLEPIDEVTFLFENPS